ncbi:transposase [Deinococcus caeni]|uniref:Transposase n=1 Tax=Deinococcus caeni TaxID=569127 RepID=A0ABP9UJD7_9DEIO
MKHKQYSENEILDVLAQVEAGTAVGDVARLSGVSKATIHRWQARYGGMTKDDAKRVRQLEEENRRLKKLVADLALDNSILKEVVGRSVISARPGAHLPVGHSCRYHAVHEHWGD